MAVRLDKWLWAARFFKTRGLATEMVKGGHVQINGERAKASKQVVCGDRLSIVRNHETYIVVVTALAEKRGSASIAQSLYNEDEQSKQEREDQRLLRKISAPPAPDKRPDKKARRQIIKFRRRED